MNKELFYEHKEIPLQFHVRRPFANFVDSPYYSESELCGGAMTVSFSKYFPWQAMLFLQRPTNFSKTCCTPFAASFRRIVEQAVLPRTPFSWLEKPRNRIGRDLDCMADVLMGSTDLGERIHCHFSIAQR
jgi:hypothetical protein